MGHEPASMIIPKLLVQRLPPLGVSQFLLPQLLPSFPQPRRESLRLEAEVFKLASGVIWWVTSPPKKWGSYSRHFFLSFFFNI